MESFSNGDNPIDPQSPILTNVFTTQESQTQVPEEQCPILNLGRGGSSGCRGRNGGGGEASATTSVATSKRKCKSTSTVWQHFDRFEEVDNDSNTKHIAQCKYCYSNLQGDTIHDTPYLRRHSKKCLQKLTQSGGSKLRQT